MHQSSLIFAVVACFVAALTVAVDAEPVIKHKYDDTAAFKPYFCNAFHTGCRRACLYEFEYVSSTCKASKDKKYFTVDCQCKDTAIDFTSDVLKHTKQTAQRTLKKYYDGFNSVYEFEKALKGDCKAVCKGSKVTAQFNVLSPKDPYAPNYAFKCKCGKHYVNDLVDHWVRIHWDV